MRAEIIKEFGELAGLLDKVNVPSNDNGRHFTDLSRMNNIQEALNESPYKLMHRGDLCYLWKHVNYRPELPAVLISCHVDSPYKKHHWQYFGEGSAIGTFDNSICNAALVLLMRSNLLDANAIISFTGDEEEDSGGAAETIEYLMKRQKRAWSNLAVAITLDVTGVGYDNHDFSIENWFIEKNPEKTTEFCYKNKRQFRDHISLMTDGAGYKILYVGDNDENAAPDESWAYDEYDLNCFSMCLPVKSHPDNSSRPAEDWMHDDKGIILKKESALIFMEGLQHICARILNRSGNKKSVDAE